MELKDIGSNESPSVHLRKKSTCDFSNTIYFLLNYTPEVMLINQEMQHMFTEPMDSFGNCCPQCLIGKDLFVDSALVL